MESKAAPLYAHIVGWLRGNNSSEVVWRQGGAEFAVLHDTGKRSVVEDRMRGRASVAGGGVICERSLAEGCGAHLGDCVFPGESESQGREVGGREDGSRAQMTILCREVVERRLASRVLFSEDFF